MQFPRESGILLHPTSLPGPHGIGDFGPAAFRFVEWLEAAGQRLWQVMPLGPTGFGDSPYASPSAFAGNPLLISLGWLAGEGLLANDEIVDSLAFDQDRVDFETVAPFKEQRLRRAFAAFRGPAGDRFRDDFVEFQAAEGWWLADYALFMAIKRDNAMAGWQSWPREVRLRETAALDAARSELADEIEYVEFAQWCFQRQWMELRRFANERGIRIVGDIPIFVAEDSADVWGSQDQFQLDAEGRARVVAGVPPDPFSATGQIWGNPLFDWPAMSDDGFGWWKRRIARTLDYVDVIRIDHFRGFAAAWAVPAGSATAAEGHWERSPGGDVFASIQREFGPVPIIIEDLGVITPDVISLREILAFPGMNVLQFAFDSGAGNVYLPHNYRRDSVVYTATHDNQTTVGWFSSLPEAVQTSVQRYLGTDGSDIAWDLIRLALASVANTAIIPMQDVLRRGDDARMNVPGSAEGNWGWRCRESDFDAGLAAGLRLIAETYGRVGNDKPEQGINAWDYTRPGSDHAIVDRSGQPL
jgi:4-alpha-glucanotransferase